MKDLKREIKQAAEQLRSAAIDGESAEINVAARRNIVVAENVGEPGGIQHASSRQSVRITQRDGSTVAETEDSGAV